MKVWQAHTLHQSQATARQEVLHHRHGAAANLVDGQGSRFGLESGFKYGLGLGVGLGFTTVKLRANLVATGNESMQV